MPHSSSPARKSTVVRESESTHASSRRARRAGPPTVWRPSRYTSMSESGGARRGLAARCPRRTRYIAIFVDEVQVVVVALDGLWNQHLGFSVARFRLLADIPVAI